MVKVLAILSKNIRKKENNRRQSQNCPLPLDFGSRLGYIIFVNTDFSMNRPEPLLSFSDYLEDFKIRVKIHNYEVEKLYNDVKFMFDLVLDNGYYRLINN